MVPVLRPTVPAATQLFPRFNFRAIVAKGERYAVIGRHVQLVQQCAFYVKGTIERREVNGYGPGFPDHGVLPDAQRIPATERSLGGPGIRSANDTKYAGRPEERVTLHYTGDELDTQH